jgi:glycosyltransferase involved in cell wall biosynthesis
MAAQRAVVATRVQGPNEVIVDGETGYLVPPQDPASLAAAVIRLLQDPTKRERMGRNGRARVEQDFSLEGMVSATVQAYRTVLPNQHEG